MESKGEQEHAGQEQSTVALDGSEAAGPAAEVAAGKPAELQQVAAEGQALEKVAPKKKKVSHHPAGVGGKPKKLGHQIAGNIPSIILRVAAGETAAQVARALDLNVSTVATHLRRPWVKEQINRVREAHLSPDVWKRLDLCRNECVNVLRHLMNFSRNEIVQLGAAKALAILTIGNLVNIRAVVHHTVEDTREPLKNLKDALEILKAAGKLDKIIENQLVGAAALPAPETKQDDKAEHSEG